MKQAVLQDTRVFTFVVMSWCVVMSGNVADAIQSLHERLVRLEECVIGGERLRTFEDDHGIDVFDGTSGPMGNMTGVHVAWAVPDGYDTIKFQFILFVPGHNVPDDTILKFVRHKHSNIIDAAQSKLADTRNKELMEVFRGATGMDIAVHCQFNIYGFAAGSRPGIVIDIPFEDG